MSGTWILRTAKPHVCNPAADAASTFGDAWIGSVWACGVCQKQWTVTQDPTTQALTWVAQVTPLPFRGTI